MRYMLLIYQDDPAWAGLPPELAGSGECLGGAALAPPAAIRTVRVRGGAAVVTDGPLRAATALLAGYVLVECETPERAVEIAARWPRARYRALEVRPLMHDSAEEY